MDLKNHQGWIRKLERFLLQIESLSGQLAIGAGEHVSIPRPKGSQLFADAVLECVRIGNPKKTFVLDSESGLRICDSSVNSDHLSVYLPGFMSKRRKSEPNFQDSFRTDSWLSVANKVEPAYRALRRT